MSIIPLYIKQENHWKILDFMKKNNGTESYMEMCIHLEGKDNVYLRIPTVWDDIFDVSQELGKGKSISEALGSVK